jgi:hypothetical protein
MAGFNEIQHARINRFFQLFSGIKGRVPAASLGTEIQPQVALFSGAEDRSLQSWARYGASKDLAAVAANTLGWQIRNPNGSGVIAVVEQVPISATTSVGFHIDLSHGPGTTDLVSGSMLQTRIDGRNVNNNGSLLTTFSNVSVVETTPVYSLNVLNGSVFPIVKDDDEIPLLPGDSVLVVTQTVNIGGFVSFIWRERTLEVAEARGSLAAGGGIV